MQKLQFDHTFVTEPQCFAYLLQPLQVVAEVVALVGKLVDRPDVIDDVLDALDGEDFSLGGNILGEIFLVILTSMHLWIMWLAHPALPLEMTLLQDLHLARCWAPSSWL